MNRFNVASGFAGIVVAVWASSSMAAPTYYVSPTGNDNADGLTPQTAWASLNKVSSTSYAPGTQVLFERNGTWRGKLSATSSGTVEAPIVYGSYGTGTKPTFYGSDILSKSNFTPVAGTNSTYKLSTSTEVYSVLASGNFLNSAFLKTGQSSNAQTNINYVNSTPNSWYYDTSSKSLYVNTGGDVTIDSRQITGVTRDDVVYTNYKNNLIFKELVVDESAKYNAGYAFRAQNSINIQFLDSEAYRAGKHHFGVINTTGFVGDGLVAKYAMPDQGSGGASALVSYSDNRYSNTTSVWKNVLVSDMERQYPAWLSHGEGLGAITLESITSIGSFMDIGANTTAKNITVVDGSVWVGNALIDGLRLVGKDAKIEFWSNATVRNAVIENFYQTSSYSAPIVVRGNNNDLQFSTISIDPSRSANWPTLIAFANSNVGQLEMLGNIISSSRPIDIGWSADNSVASKLTGDYNLYNGIRFKLTNNSTVLTLDEWKMLVSSGFDLNSILAVPLFVDAASGDFRLLAYSPGVDGIPTNLGWEGLIDYVGIVRPSGAGIDFGAFEFVVPEPGSSLIVGMSLFGLGLRRRR